MEGKAKAQAITIFMLILGAVSYQMIAHGLGILFIAIATLYASGALEKLWDFVENRLDRVSANG